PASRASVATLRQKKLAPFHFCLAKNSYPLPPFSFSSQTRSAGLCSNPHGIRFDFLFANKIFQKL
ncbi:MAG: hypothetical protein IJE09_08305, partial [Oscillospiraceae bacterium]|nr:hypothetical protein [Oscillospiraceae bacterium]